MDFEKSERNYNNNNYNNMNYNNMNYNNIINPINPINQIVNDEIDYYMDIIKKNIEYDYYINFGSI